jgi:hypothetical protein
LTLDAGKFQRVEYDRRSGRVTVHLDPADRFTPKAYLNVETTTAGGRKYRAVGEVAVVRGSYAVTLSHNPAVLVLDPTR